MWMYVVEEARWAPSNQEFEVYFVSQRKLWNDFKHRGGELRFEFLVAYVVGQWCGEGAKMEAGDGLEVTEVISVRCDKQQWWAGLDNSKQFSLVGWRISHK